MTKEHLKIELSELKPNPKNPKLHDDELIKGSIKDLGFVDDIVIDEKNIILSGHGRLKALQELGTKEVDVIKISGWTQEQKDRYLLLSNKSVEKGGWDFDMLAQIDKELLKQVGFESQELDKIFKDLNKDEDEVPDVPEIPTSKLGDIYQLGEHRLICGDATKKEDVDKLMDGSKAQMCFTDPPYNVDYTGSMNSQSKNKREGIMNDNMSSGAFYLFLSEFSKRIIENVLGGVYICMSSSELSTLKRAWEDNGGHWQSFIIWVKNNFTLSRADYQQTYEPIFYGWPKDIVNHYFIQERNGANVWEDLRSVKTEFKDGYTTISFQGFKVKIKGKVEKGEVIRKRQKVDIWRYDKPSISKEHPTMKPVELCKEAIVNSSKRGDIVLDLFGGSGSTLMACQQVERKCYMMELDPKYCDVIIKRWENFTKLKAKKL